MSRFAGLVLIAANLAAASVVLQGCYPDSRSTVEAGASRTAPVNQVNSLPIDLGALVTGQEWFGHFGEHATWVFFKSGSVATPTGLQCVITLFVSSPALGILPSVATSSVDASSAGPITLSYLSAPQLEHLSIRPQGLMTWADVGSRADVFVGGEELLLGVR